MDLDNQIENGSYTNQGYVEESEKNGGIVRPVHAITIRRNIMSQSSFDIENLVVDRRNKKPFIECNTPLNSIKNFVFNLFPFIGILRQYNVRKDLPYDVSAGITLGMLQIPQAMAYGVLANVPAVYGLYTSFWPAILYFFFGTSRHISFGTFAVTSIMTANAVDRVCLVHDQIANADENNITAIQNISDDNILSADIMNCNISVATTIAFLVGLSQIILGCFRMGWVAIYLSTPLTRGFTTGASIHVFTSQVKHIFGLEIPKNDKPWKLVYDYINIFSKMDETNIATLINSVVFIIIIYCMKHFFLPWFKSKTGYPFPSEVIIVILGTVLSAYAYPKKWNMNVVELIPTGMPAPYFPRSLDKSASLIPSAITIAIICYANAVSLGKLFADKHKYSISPNQEFLACGLSNAISSCFSCFVAAPSLSRSAVLEAAGAKTQICSLVSCVLVLIVLLVAGPLFYYLPLGILAAIIMIGLEGLFKQFADLKTLWKIDRIDLSVWVVTFLGTIFLNVDFGLFVGIGFNLCTVVFRSQNPKSSILGQILDSEVYVNIKNYQDVKQMDGFKIFRFESPLHYINREIFYNDLLKKIEFDPMAAKANKKTKELSDKKVVWDIGYIDTENNHDNSLRMHTLIIDCSMMGYIDSVGVKELKRVVEEFTAVSVKVLFSGCRGRVIQTLARAEFFKICSYQDLYLSNHDAVLETKKKLLDK